MTEDHEEHIARSQELFEEIHEVLDGENVIAGLNALERTIIGIVTNNCVNRESAEDVLVGMHSTLMSLLKACDEMGFTAWAKKDTLN